MGSRIFEDGKHPIYPADIESCRENVQMGQKIKIRVQCIDADYCKRAVYRMCTVTEKHRWLFVAEDSKGRLYSMTWADMMMQGGA